MNNLVSSISQYASRVGVQNWGQVAGVVGAGVALTGTLLAVYKLSKKIPLSLDRIQGLQARSLLLRTEAGVTAIDSADMREKAAESVLGSIRIKKPKRCARRSRLFFAPLQGTPSLKVKEVTSQNATISEAMAIRLLPLRFKLLHIRKHTQGFVANLARACARAVKGVLQNVKWGAIEGARACKEAAVGTALACKTGIKRRGREFANWREQRSRRWDYDSLEMIRAVGKDNISAIRKFIIEKTHLCGRMPWDKNPEAI